MDSVSQILEEVVSRNAFGKGIHPSLLSFSKLIVKQIELSHLSWITNLREGKLYLNQLEQVWLTDGGEKLPTKKGEENGRVLISYFHDTRESMRK